MEKKGWKITAFVFMALFVLSIVTIGSFMHLGQKVINKENECAMSVCSDYGSYYYNWNTKVCSCYDSAGETAKTEYMGG